MKLFCALIFTLLAFSANAKEYKLIVNGGPGSSMDLVARIVGNSFSQKTNNIIVYEYQSGGNAFNAANAHLNGPPTLLLGNTALFVMNHVFYDSMTHYKDTDFNYVGLVTRQPILWYAKTDFAFSNAEDYINKFKNKNSNDGIGGEGLFQKLNALILIQHHNLSNVVFVPYKSSNEILVNVLNGTHSIGISSPNPTLLAQVNSGNLVILGSTWPNLVIDGKKIPYLNNTFGKQLTGLTALSVSKKFSTDEQKYLKEELWKVITDKKLSGEFNKHGIISDPIEGHKLPVMFDEMRAKLRFYKYKFNLN